ncbi:hypothetical protein MSG28_004953 [Choristoneura fumiferana]|uniref:Uncharacterized protein n=1 Tax=Choristoneura fumiferana TaxID=7141 RepID=A0ACC0JPX1_CHOFU|nr:hypothetical protein MSG28_004953 [Choristoneura fumiferana]
MVETADNVFPVKKVGGNNIPSPPWWDSECTAAAKRRKEAELAYRESSTNENFDFVLEEIDKTKKLFKKKKFEGWRNFCLSVSPNTNPSVVWNNIKRFRSAFKEDCSSNLPSTLANDFLDKLAPPTVPEFIPLPPVLDLSGLNGPFTLPELKGVISKTKDSAPGPDGIPYSFFTHLNDIPLLYFLKLINKILISGEIPETWKCQDVLPFLKPKKEPFDVSSYRPVALSTVLMKLTEHLVKNRLEWFIETNNILSQNQFGFRRGRGVTKNDMDPNVNFNSIKDDRWHSWHHIYSDSSKHASFGHVGVGVYHAQYKISQKIKLPPETFMKITPYEIELPPEVISIKYDTKVMRDELINQLNDLMLKGHETFSSVTETEAEKDYQAFKHHTEQIHVSLTTVSLQENSDRAAVVRSLWNVSDRIILGEKMLRDAQEKWASPAPKNKPPPDTPVEDKSDFEESSGEAIENSEPSKDEKEHAGTEEDEEKGDKKTVRQILSQLLSNKESSNQSGMIISSGLVPVVVMAGEIGSVIAATLASVTYQRSLRAQRHSNQTEQEEGEPNTGKDKTDGDKNKAAKSNEHIEVLLKDALICRVYYASQFHKLRHMLLAPLGANPHIADAFAAAPAPAPAPGDARCCDDRDKGDSKSLCVIEEGFVRSLAHCVPWAARGGKSGSTFCKTTDERYVLKEMTKPEWQQFLEFAPHYFNYVTSCRSQQLPSLLGETNNTQILYFYLF